MFSSHCSEDMADNLSKEKRSYAMSCVKSKNTRPEMLVRKFLHSKGFRYRLHSKQLPGKPDVVLSMYKAVVFVHGCFWHHHYSGCSRSRLPKSNVEFWEKKIKRNIDRDKQNLQHLHMLGWRTFIVWECGLSKSRRDLTLNNLVHDIRDGALNIRS
ncbi:very short patch repair endonuclease [Pontibacter roseus]|uniref:very short patch repair endonuclease n=1 Tax=Pontibacter roseus TaxID=336989 RepID=UPI002ADE0A2D|nr:very short patch repair endonuclease [Pontibacter roseus]